MSGTIAYFLLILLQLAVIVRALLRPHREAASRVAWVVVIAAVPVLGIVAYFLFGETNIGVKRAARARSVLASLPAPTGTTDIKPEIPERFAPLFRLGESINGFEPVGGNSAQLTEDSNAAIDSLVADMDAAANHIHIAFYIWLTDGNGLKVVEALKRAVARGVTCRAMADGLGSRQLIGSSHWTDMRDSGVRLGVALPVDNPLLHPFRGRIDLRNHRKIVVIDDWVTYCGSQNCADPEFRIKPKFAPWVDILMRFSGPIARQNQHVFASDWMTYVDEDISEILGSPLRTTGSGFPAQVIATGPTVRASAMPETFESLMYMARETLVVTTPYYVPNESMQDALCTAANRGVETIVVVPARNDSLFVAAASRSHYKELLEAGVAIYEYRDGLLHTKSMTVDGCVTLIGSANMDRRSFDLNYENNILFVDEALTSDVEGRQRRYIGESDRVLLNDVEKWSAGQRLWHNTLAMLGPLL